MPHKSLQLCSSSAMTVGKVVSTVFNIKMHIQQTSKGLSLMVTLMVGEPLGDAL